jgi:hypothetical protein
MKHEYMKHEKALYGSKDIPQLLEVPAQKFFCIKGKGNPNGADFSERIGALYSLAYAIRMMPKNGFTPDGYFEYTVYPLEGIWDLTDEGKASQAWTKDELVYTIMIRQPDFVTPEVAQKAFAIVGKKKPHALLKEAFFEEIADGLCVQILHCGSYDAEPASFAKMKDFLQKNHCERRLLSHREIYLSDARKVETKQLKTILRYTVKKG